MGRVVEIEYIEILIYIYLGFDDIHYIIEKSTENKNIPLQLYNKYVIWYLGNNKLIKSLQHC